MATAKKRLPRKVPVPAKNPGQWVFAVEGWRPASLNELLAAGRWGSGRLKKRDRDYIALFSRPLRIPEASGKRRVSLVITLPPRGRRHDIDAFQKSTLDGATKAKLIQLDSPDWAEWGGVKYEKGGKLSTLIIVEDIDV